MVSDKKCTVYDLRILNKPFLLWPYKWYMRIEPFTLFVPFWWIPQFYNTTFQIILQSANMPIDNFLWVYCLSITFSFEDTVNIVMLGMTNMWKLILLKHRVWNRNIVPLFSALCRILFIPRWHETLAKWLSVPKKNSASLRSEILYDMCSR